MRSYDATMPRDRLLLTPDPIDVVAVMAFVADDDAGAIDLFLGTTRATTREDGASLAALDYDAYDAMVARSFESLAARAREQWPICRLAIVHRRGRVEVGEASVAIAVSAPHRDQAFAACRFLIDTLKQDAAIWKLDVWNDAPATWQAGTERTDPV